MCNKSLLEGHLPSSQTSAIISPVIKMSGLDPDGVRSYLPISNLTYMSKIIDRMMYKQLADYLGKHSLLPEYQSGFRAHHSTETAVRKIMSDILSAADHGTVTLLGLLDMSAAFDTVEHFIVLDRLGTSFGIRGTALAWLDHSSPAGNNRSSSTVSSSTIYITTGVPQGSVWGPLLFLLYSADLPVIADQHGLGVHCYADDGQIYVFDKAGNAEGMVAKVSACIAEIDPCMTTNRLKLNSDKTQFIWLGIRQQLLKVNVVNVQMGDYSIPLQSNVCSLRVLLDSQLNMRTHVQRICRSSFYQLWALVIVTKN